MDDIRALVAAIGPESLPGPFLAAMASGQLATDFSGRFVDLLKAHFEGGSAK
jgi:hypothetical protein